MSYGDLIRRAQKNNLSLGYDNSRKIYELRNREMDVVCASSSMRGIEDYLKVKEDTAAWQERRLIAHVQKHHPKRKSHSAAKRLLASKGTGGYNANTGKYEGTEAQITARRMGAIKTAERMHREGNNRSHIASTIAARYKLEIGDAQDVANDV
jgi:hypothetical protein